MDNANITSSLVRLRQHYGDKILSLFAMEVTRRGLEDLKEITPDDNLTTQLNNLAKDLNNANWNIVRSVIKRCL